MTTDVTAESGVSAIDAAFKAAAHARYAGLRAGGPIHRVRLLNTLDVSRPITRHLAFGHGIHHCLGAPLAHMEAEIGIGTLLRRFPDLRPTIPLADLNWRSADMMRGPVSLPVLFTRQP